jgi:hypothetical protein
VAGRRPATLLAPREDRRPTDGREEVLGLGERRGATATSRKPRTVAEEALFERSEASENILLSGCEVFVSDRRERTNGSSGERSESDGARAK